MDTIIIRRADMADARRITHIMAQAFQADPVSCWLMPDPDDRARRHPEFFRVFVDNAILWGEVHVTGDFEGVALWLDVDPHEPVRPSDDDFLFERALQQNFARFEMLATLTGAMHPENGKHAYLPFVAVMPEHQGHGIGWTLLRHKLSELDIYGRPAYLEASSTRSRALYRRLGFQSLPTPIQLPNGPEMYPMWREPMPPA